MMKYLFITAEAIQLFVNDRYFVSAEYNASAQLYNILKRKDTRWNYKRIHFMTTKEGGLFYTSSGNISRGLIFDFSLFRGFDESVNTDDKIIVMFQRVLKYAIRYFSGDPTVNCERELANNLTLVFPFSFTPNLNVEKVLIDRNSINKNRQEKDYLTVFYFGKDSDGKQMNYVNTMTAVREVSSLRLELPQDKVSEDSDRRSSEYHLSKLPLKLESQIGFDGWDYYLTDVQKRFVNNKVEGPERLEGAAGTGKTLSLVLRSLYLLREKKMSGEEFHLLFITHSSATQEHIIDVMKKNSGGMENFLEDVRQPENRPDVSVCVTTLQELCVVRLGREISETECLDKDASESKFKQMEYILKAWEEVYVSLQKVIDKICSKKFRRYISATNDLNVLEMLQSEIAVQIKGRAKGIPENYKAQSRPVAGIPIETDGDKAIMYAIYEKYQESLERANLFDSDDIIISALATFKTPIWNRRLPKEGFDATFIDETHLFNLNELSVLLHVNKPSKANHIVYAIDKSQAVGDMGITNEMVEEAVGARANEGSNRGNTKFITIFRSSYDVINLAFNILSAGANMFKGLENPLKYSNPSFTESEERKSITPAYHLFTDDMMMVDGAFSMAEQYCKKYDCRRSDVLLVAADWTLMKHLAEHKRHRAVMLQSRGDNNTVEKAEKSNSFVIGGIDFVGGLEFDAVLIVGVDKKRVPPTESEKTEPYYYMDYAWRNRLYVAITRAKYTVQLIGTTERGASPLFDLMIDKQMISLNAHSDIKSIKM